MPDTTDDLRIREIKELSRPAEVMAEFPRTDAASRTVSGARRALHAILHGSDDRLAVVIGPCSIHDPAAAIDYAKRLLPVRERLKGELEIIMRVYFEKPHTTVGWKGLINDPDLDGSFHIDKGLRLARNLLLQINDLNLTAAPEVLGVQTLAPSQMTIRITAKCRPNTVGEVTRLVNTEVKKALEAKQASVID